MPLLRNPFARRGGAPAPLLLEVDSIPADASSSSSTTSATSTSSSADDSSSRPPSSLSGDSTRGFESVETVGSMTSSRSIAGRRRSHDTGEYQMSVVNDSGVWVPPSPAEEPAAWPRRFLSSRSSDAPSSLSGGAGDIEPFSISRESFDSYRRSFDITAKSPVGSSHGSARQSIDSPRWARVPRTPFADLDPPPTLEEADAEDGAFEDVGLDDASAKAPPRRRGFFFRYAEEENDGEYTTTSSSLSPAGGVSRFLMPGRRGRAAAGQQQQGAELGVLAKSAERAAVRA